MDPRLARVLRAGGLAALALVPSLAVPPAADAATYATTVRTLWAGKKTAVGTVTVTRDDAAVKVVYAITADGWALTETHLFVGVTPPKKSAPGSFPFQHRLQKATRDEYRIPYSLVGARAVDCVIVAAHADVVRRRGSRADEWALSHSPCGLVTYSVVGPGTTCYMDVHLAGAGLDGVYHGWCVDLDHHIANDTLYTALAFSSYDPRSWDYVDRPENLDLANYVIAHKDDYLAAGFWWRSIQEALWRLLDDRDPQFLGNPEEVQVILDDAAREGEGFLPGCDDSFGLILVPVEGCAQVAQTTFMEITLAQYGVPCRSCWRHETAWAFADGDTRLTNGKGRVTGWGRWFTACP